MSARCVLVLVALCASAAACAADPYAEMVVKADAANEKYPLVTVSRPDITVGQSYAIQRDIVAAKLAAGDSIAGYKGGLMSAASQQMRGANGPVFGVLLKSGEKTPAVTVSLSQFRSMYIECEIGFVFSQRIDKPIGSVEALKAYVGAVRPALEVPDAAYLTMPHSVFDLIASNVSARDYVLGAPVPLAKAGDPNHHDPVLYLNGNEVARGKATKALGDQWKALLATVNLVVGQGYSIEPGQTIITGSLASVTVTAPGTYRADYGDFGEVTLRVAP